MSYLSHDHPPKAENWIIHFLSFAQLYYLISLFFVRILVVHLFVYLSNPFVNLLFYRLFVFWFVEIVDSYGLLLYLLKLSNETIQNKMIWEWDLVECADIIYMVHLILFIHRVRLHSTDFLGRTVVGQRNWGCDLCAL